MPTINKNLFLGTIFGPYAIQLVLGLAGLLLSLFGNDSLAVAALGLSCFSLIFAIVAIVMVAILVYKLWDSIQDGQARTTPGKACGFLFIPFFNFYWLFVAYLGWAKDFNAYAGERNIEGTRMNEGLTLAMCIFVVVSVLVSLIPFVGFLTGIVNAVLLFLFFSPAIDGANAARALRVPAPEPQM